MKVGLKATARAAALADSVVVNGAERDGALRDPMVERAIAHATRGDGDAVRYLYIRYADGVYGYVRSLVRSDEIAYDVTENVFATLATTLDTYDADDAPFQVWLLRLAHGRSTEFARSRRRRFVRS